MITNYLIKHLNYLNKFLLIFHNLLIYFFTRTYLHTFSYLSLLIYIYRLFIY